jgi:hypothetical protein
MSDELISKDKVRELLEKRRDALRRFLPHRKVIEAAADGNGFLPDNHVLRAMCCYIAGDLVTFVDADEATKGLKP